MAEWSQLPQDLLVQISSKVSYSCIDLIRFRSVCSSWRSSHPPYYFPSQIPINPSWKSLYYSPDGILDSYHVCLSKRVILHLSLPNQNNGWIIKLERDVSDMYSLLNPLSELKIQPLPIDFPKGLNFMGFRIWELGQQYVLKYSVRLPIGLDDNRAYIYRQKVVFSSNSPWNDVEEIDYVIMTLHASGKLALFRLKDRMWSIIEDMSNPYVDVIYYKGKFYAVDNTGRTVVVGTSLIVTEVANAIFRGDKKSLVELDGELLLIDSLFQEYERNDLNGETYIVNDDTYMADNTVQFKVFKLDLKEKEWVEVKHLGDHMLFLGDNCSFSALASDFIGSKGNCIYFNDKYLQSNKEEDGLLKGHCMGVFNLEDLTIKPLASSPGYSHSFWPPPSWVTSPTS
ncbi:hypothetical protein AQUCO_04300060v1 [Aquilegia coerulea]|uniref:F-box domain-containing protein n=1 Tax=Aquilegia coerulea TaxID=218851 RepID=A0A2G5CNI6_AQUCA|nr:hypothetical protein AQUCO_04300060v1 [Aquilegia coerulea]